MKQPTAITAVVVLATLAAACAACSQKSAVKNETGAQLALKAPAGSTIAPGETCNVDVSIARTGIDDPVAIRFDGLPAGVAVVEQAPVVPAGSDAASFTLHADNDVKPVDGQVVTITASAGSDMSVSKQFSLRVLPKN